MLCSSLVWGDLRTAVSNLTQGNKYLPSPPTVWNVSFFLGVGICCTSQPIKYSSWLHRSFTTSEASNFLLIYLLWYVPSLTIPYHIIILSCPRELKYVFDCIYILKAETSWNPILNGFLRPAVLLKWNLTLRNSTPFSLTWNEWIEENFHRIIVEGTRIVAAPDYWHIFPIFAVFIPTRLLLLSLASISCNAVIDPT